MNQTTIHENVSALADGQLQGEEFARVIDALCAQDELRARWQTYHLVGDVLRSGQHPPCSDTGLFVARLRQRLAAESAMAPRAQAGVARQPVSGRVEAANQPVFRWKLVAGLASLAAAAAIGWNWVGSVGGAVPAGAQLAQQQPPQNDPGAASVLAASQSSSRAATPTRVVIGTVGAPQVMLRDARLDEMLAAHQQAGGASQMPSGFLRNATFEGPSR